MKSNARIKMTLGGFVLLMVLYGFVLLSFVDRANSAPTTTLESLRISAVFDNRRNQEYLHVLDMRNGDLWKYNMDAPGDEPRYIGKLVTPGKELQQPR